MQHWDKYDAYLFDIDGTLLHCRDAVHYFAFCDALSSVADKPLNLDGVLVHGNTDVGILRDVLKLHHIPETAWRPRLKEILDGMCSYVADRRGELCAEAIEGAQVACEHLRGRGAVLGVATGNLAGIGQMKLERAGLAHLFDFGAFSNAFEYRRDVIRSGIEGARRRTHPDARICVVGDTPSDVQAAQDNGVDVIAVATGIFPLDELCAAGATYCVPSLTTLLAKGSEAYPEVKASLP